MKRILVVILILKSNFIFSQNLLITREIDGKDSTCTLMEYLSRNVKYPAEARVNCIVGKVYVSFKINKDGIIDSVFLKSTVNKIIDDEAIKVIKFSNGHLKIDDNSNLDTTIFYTVPINFSLRNAGCKDGNYYYNLGVEWFKKEDMKKAVEYFNKTLELDAFDVDALYNLSVIYIKQNEIESACKCLNKIKDLGKYDGDELLSKYCKN